MAIQNDRFRSHKLSADAKPKLIYEFFVSCPANRAFPIDMLRYDACWPARQDDVGLIEADQFRASVSRSVKLCSYRAPTIDRWSSFGWTVSQTPIYTIE